MTDTASTPSSAKLVLRAQAGDAAAMEQLLTELAPKVRRFGLRLCGQDGEDALQDTLLTIAQKLGDFRAEGSLSTWAYTIVRSACSRSRRGLKNAPALPIEDAPEQASLVPDPEAAILSGEQHRMLEGALCTLEDGLREAVLLRDVEGLSAKEAAVVVGITVAALKSRLHRGRAALADAIAAQQDRAAPKAACREGCPDILRAVSEQREGDLSALDCKALEEHVAACPHCDAACQRLRGVLVECGALNEDEENPELAARVRTAYLEWRQAL